MSTTVIRLETRKLNQKIENLLVDVTSLHTKALSALENADINMAIEVIDDKNIDAQYLDIEGDLEFMVTKAPVDKDLRRTLAYISISKELRRISKYARHVAKFVIWHQGKIEKSSIRRIKTVQTLIIDRLKNLKKALVNEDFELAIKIAQKDKVVDKKVEDLRKELVLSVVEKGGRYDEVDERIFVLNTINRLERAGDHIVNICEMIVYIANGQHAFLG